MELKLNREGLQYIIGVPLQGEVFSQLVIQPGELQHFHLRETAEAFESLEEARQVKDELVERNGKTRCYLRGSYKTMLNSQDNRASSWIGAQGYLRLMIPWRVLEGRV